MAARTQSAAVRPIALLCAKVNARAAVLYYQHLSPGLKVKRGQKVKKGQWFAKVGQPVTALGTTCTSRRRTCRGLRKDHPKPRRVPADTTTCAPRRSDCSHRRGSGDTETREGLPIVDASIIAAACRRNARYDGVVTVRKALGIKGGNKCDAYFRRAYAKYQRSLGYKGKAANGVPGYQSLRVLGDRKDSEPCGEARRQVRRTHRLAR